VDGVQIGSWRENDRPALDKVLDKIAERAARHATPVDEVHIFVDDDPGSLPP
jgi:hypothetical protein